MEHAMSESTLAEVVEGQPTLLNPIVAHCFLELRGFCEHTVSGFDINDVHDRMEQHYAERHQAWIDSIVGWMR